MARRFVGRAMGAVVSPIIEAVDVDGVVRRIDVEDIVERIDINELLNRVDIDAILERVDLNRQIERVDIDAVMNKIDINALIARSDLEGIIARSSSGVFGTIIDICRNQIGILDQNIQRVGRCACVFSRHKPHMLPPRPTSRKKQKLEKEIPCPAASQQMGLALQGRYAGLFPRVVAFAIDWLFVYLTFGVVYLIAQTAADTVDWGLSNTWLLPLMYYIYSLAYEALSLGLAGRTLGLSMIGLRVVCSNGLPIGFVRAFIRAYIRPFTNLFTFGYLVSWVRRDGRAIHDLLTFTGIIYSWDAKYAYLRQQTITEKDSVYESDDDLMGIEDDEEAQYNH